MNITIEQTSKSTNQDVELELQNYLQSLYAKAKKTGTPMKWKNISSLDSHHLKQLSDVPEPSQEEISSILNKLVVIKLNGGLGTSMGCTGPKSILPVSNQLSFLDLTILQIQTFNEQYKCDIPLILMNSFNTDADTESLIKERYSNPSPVKIYTFSQHKMHRIVTNSEQFASSEFPELVNESFYPPGHGDVYRSLVSAPFFSKLLETGKEYAFMSNIDNMGALVNPHIISAMVRGSHKFLMEVTSKTVRDIKGGMPVLYTNVTATESNECIKLLETAQVPKEHMGEFCSISKFKIFNTNNLYYHLPTLQKLATPPNHLSSPHMDIIINSKTLSNGTPVTQLEQASGSAIQSFPNPLVIQVPRDRFLPVKSTSDLFIVQSNLFTQKNGIMNINPLRGLPDLPFIQLGPSLKHVSQYQSAFKGNLPNIIDLIQLVISGNVSFGNNVTLKGNVFISSTDDYTTQIDDDSILENCFIVNGTIRSL